MRIMEELGFFFALGVVIVFVAATALGRILSVPAGLKTVEPDAEADATDEAAAAAPLPTRTVPARTVSAQTAGTEDTPRAGDTQTIG